MIMDEVVKDLGELTADVVSVIISSHAGNAGPLLEPVVNFLLKNGLDKVIKDVVSRQLSDMQKDKVNEVRDYAISTFYKLAEEKGWEDNGAEGDAYTQTIAESIEDIFNKAVNESRKAKRVLLGTLLGTTMYYSNSPHPDMENFFYVSTITDRLTFRQLCLVLMIGNKFSDIKGDIHNLCVTDKVSISELDDLKSQGLWRPLFGFMGGSKDPEYPIPLDYMVPTNTAIELMKAIILPDEIKDEYYRVLESLGIKPINPSEFPGGFLETRNSFFQMVK